MRPAKTAFILTAVGALACAPAVASAAPVATTTSFPTVYALAQYGPCVGMIDSSVNGNAYPNQAAFNVSANTYGFGNCGLRLTLSWRNIDTNATGVVTADVKGPGYWSKGGYSALFAPGIGRFVGTLTVDGQHFPEPGQVSFEVKKYQG